MKHVSIVIVNWNGREDTLQCLESVKHLVGSGIRRRVIVVDNGSTDGSVSFIRTKFPEVQIIQNRRNLGFTGGNNAGIRMALEGGASYIWLLNNDTVVDKHALAELIDAMTADGGIAGPKIYFAPGFEFHKERYTKAQLGNVLWYAGGRIDWKNMYASHRGVDEVDHGDFDTKEETAFVTGCSMLVKREVFDSIGNFDDRYYLYLEDVDFCLRAKRAGYKILYVPTSIIWHKNAGSTDTPGHDLHQYYVTRNRLLIGMKFAPLRTKLALVKEGVGFFFRGNAPKRKAVVDALFCRFGDRYAWSQ